MTLDRVGFVAHLDVNRHPLTLHADEKKDNFNLKLVPVEFYRLVVGQSVLVYTQMR